MCVYWVEYRMMLYDFPRTVKMNYIRVFITMFCLDQPFVTLTFLRSSFEKNGNEIAIAIDKTSMKHIPFI